MPIPDPRWYAQSVSFITGDVSKSKIFSTIFGSLKYAYLCLPMYACRIVATFTTPVSYNGINVLELMTSSGTVEMAAKIRGTNYPGE